jgi:predicted nucleic acid-binding protein
MRIFWDTNLFIYLWEKGPWTEAVRKTRARMKAQDCRWATSTLTVGEILVHPLRQGQAAQAARYREAFRSIEVVPFNEEAAARFAALRARHPRLRPPDAIQLACASVISADWFLTHDQHLRGLKVDGIGRVASFREFAEENSS